MAVGGGKNARDAEERLWLRVQQFAHEIPSQEHYAALLSDSEIPTVLVECLEHLRVRPDPERLQQVISILLQMIDMPEQLDRSTAGHAQPSPHHAEIMEHARNWAMDTLLDVHMTVNSDGISDPPTPAESLNIKLPMQQLQTSLCTYTALNNSSHVVDEMQESIFTLFALQQVQLEDAAFAQVLDLCATSVLDDLEFALFVDAMLGSRDIFTVSRVFLDRLFRTESKALILASGSSLSNGDPASQHAAPASVQVSRLFDQLSFVSMVRVWGNHLPSWEAQLQEWLLQAHATPFIPMASIVWKYQEGVEPENARATFQSYSYLYSAMLSWFATNNSEFLASPRSTELLGFLSKLTRLSDDHRAHNRILVHALGLKDSGETSSDILTLVKRVHAFAKVEHALQSLLHETAASDQQQSEALASHLQYEWMGLAECPYILQEALELLFATPNEAKEVEKLAAGSQQAQGTRRGAASLIGWFYAFTTTNSNNSSNNASAKSIAALTLELASSLDLVDLFKGSAFLQQKRGEFQLLTQLRIKIVWFWLLKCCFASADSIQNDAAVVDALESIEYAFRRFAPAKNKRSFQVEAVAQLLFDLEWRWKAVIRQKYGSSRGQQTQLKELQERVDVPVAWLKKIVHLMQIEHQQQHHHQRLPSVIAKAGDGALTHSEQLAVRLEHLFGSG